MNWKQIKVLKEEVIAFAKEIGIDKIGFASADPFLELKDRLIRHRELGYESGFEEEDIDKRTHPELTMPEARSIIAIALAYPSRIPDPPQQKRGEYRGIVSRAAWGEDYHHVLRRKLRELEAFLQEKVPGVQTEIMVDTGVLSDRAVAERAGLGWVGKNCSIITPEFGSWVYLGEMLTNIPFSPDVPIEDGCGTCTLCIEACPTGAIVQPGQLDSQRCLAYVTQVRNFVADEFRDKLGNMVYGCDICQQVCPKNYKINFTHQKELMPDAEVAKPLLKPLLHIGKKQFNETWGPTAAAWRGKKPIQRNAIIALAHFKDKSAIPDLIQLLHEDPREAIRGTAAWALGKIGGGEALAALEEANSRENDLQVLEEIEKGLAVLGKSVNNTGISQ